jgi:predicted PurR-regulated permease PerM
MHAKRLAKQSSPPNDRVTRPVPRSVQVATILALLAGLLLIRPYAGTVLFAVLVAFIFNPVYRAVLRRSRRRGLAVLATIATALLSFILPLLVVVAVTVGQVNSLRGRVQAGQVDISSAHIEQVVDRGAERLQGVVDALPGGASFHPDKQKIHQQLKSAFGNLLEGIVNLVKRTGGVLAGLIPTSILALSVITNVLIYQTELVAFLKRLSPFHDEMNDLYLKRAGDMYSLYCSICSP